jgi:hypothetical protein
MNDTLTYRTNLRYYQYARTIAEPRNTSKASGRDKIRNTCDKGTWTIHGRLCYIFRIQAKNYNPCWPTRVSNRLKASQLIFTLFTVPEFDHLSTDTKVQLMLNVLAILAATANIVTAAAPRRYGPIQYRPAQYGGNTVPWTSSTCSAVYSILTQTSSRPVTSVVTTTKYKPSTWTSTSPTVITSVYTAFKPATTSVVTTITTTYVGKYKCQYLALRSILTHPISVTSTKTSTSVVTSSTAVTSELTSSTVVCKTIPIVSPVVSTSYVTKTQTLPYVTPCTGKLPIMNLWH